MAHKQMTREETLVEKEPTENGLQKTDASDRSSAWGDLRDSRKDEKRLPAFLNHATKRLIESR